MGSKSFGASDGNRTHATSLEGWDSTIELHSHGLASHKYSPIIPHHSFFVKTYFKNFQKYFLKIVSLLFIFVFDAIPSLHGIKFVGLLGAHAK